MSKCTRVSMSAGLLLQHGLRPAAFSLLCGEAQAHGLGARYDLPLPLWLYLLGAAAAVAASFALLASFRTSTRSVSSRTFVWAKSVLPVWLGWVLPVASVGMLVFIPAAG